MSMRPEDTPRRQERLILADATQRFERLLVNRMFATNDVPAFAEPVDQIYGSPCINDNFILSVSLYVEYAVSCTVGKPKACCQGQW
jgi:hypothetical protein